MLPSGTGRVVACVKEKIDNSKKPNNVKKSPSTSPDYGVGPKVDRSGDFLQVRLEGDDGHIITLTTHLTKRKEAKQCKGHASLEGGSWRCDTTLFSKSYAIPTPMAEISEKGHESRGYLQDHIQDYEEQELGKKFESVSETSPLIMTEPSIDQDTVTYSESRIVMALMIDATVEEYVLEDYLQVHLRRQEEQILALEKMVFEMKDKLNTIMEEAHLEKELARFVDKGGGGLEEPSFKEEDNKLEDPRVCRVKKYWVVERQHQSIRLAKGEGKPWAPEMEPQIDGVGGHHPIVSKPCPRKERQVPLPETSRQPNFDGTGTVTLHL
ncbi:hypothetical protein AAC387_Pa10g0868 [Persea americana]